MKWNSKLLTTFDYSMPHSEFFLQMIVVPWLKHHFFLSLLNIDDVQVIYGRQTVFIKLVNLRINCRSYTIMNF